MLPALQLPDVLNIDTPSSSPGSTKCQKRTMVQIHFQQSIKDTLTVETIIRRLKRALDPFGAVVGQVETMSSRPQDWWRQTVHKQVMPSKAFPVVF